jgi:hypothetical protein
MNLAAIESTLRKELPARSVQDIEGFPCGGYSDFLRQRKSGQLRVLTTYDPDAFGVLATPIQLTINLLLSWAPALLSLALLMASFFQWNFWLLLGIPLALLGFLLTTPGLMRSFGYTLLLIAMGLAIYYLVRGNYTAVYILGAFVASNFLGAVVREQCNLILSDAVSRSELVLVWLYLKGSVLVEHR